MTATKTLNTTTLVSVLGLMLAFELSAKTEPRVPIGGSVPSPLRSPARAAWIPAAAETDTLPVCELDSPRTWRCVDLRPTSRGLVVIVGDGETAYVPVGIPNAQAGIVSWGCLVRVNPAAVALEDVHDLRLTAWRPEQPRLRSQSRWLATVRDPAIQILQLSSVAFWVYGDGEPPGRDSFVRIDGPSAISRRLPTSSLLDGALDVPVLVDVFAPMSMSGRVENDNGPVGGADLELFERLPADVDADRERARLVRRARTRATEDGTFTFEGLEPGRFEVVASHRAMGRGRAEVESLGATVLVKMVAPARALGRVLRAGVQVRSARIRFVPDPSAWMASADPLDHIVEDTYTDEDGRFILPLPREHVGSIQIVASDGAVARLGLPSGIEGDVNLGDLVLPNAHRAVVRFIDGMSCDLSAVGPLGMLGLTMIRAVQSSSEYVLDLPEAGGWMLAAECGGHAYRVEPPVLSVDGNGTEPRVDVRLVRSGEER